MKIFAGIVLCLKLIDVVGMPIWAIVGENYGCSDFLGDVFGFFASLVLCGRIFGWW